MMTAMLRSVPYFISVFIVTSSTCVILVYDDDCYSQALSTHDTSLCSLVFI